jgi:phosphate-selective porin OprO/OprP
MLSLLIGAAGGLSAPLAVPHDPPPSEEETSLELTATSSEPVSLPVADGTITWSWKNGLRFQTDDGSVKGKFGGRIHYDLSWLDIDDSLGLDDADGAQFRRARMFVSLDVDDFFMKAEYDFAGQDVDFNDVWIGRYDVLGSADLKVGHMKEPFSLDYLTSANNITFLERSLMESLTLGRNTGAQLSDTLGESANWAVGVFKNANDAGTNQMDGDYAATARVSGSPLYRDGGRELLHVGAAYSMRDAAELRFRQRPELHLAPFTLDTGTIPAEDVSYANLECAGVFGAAHFQAEVTSVSASGTGGSPDFDATGFYGQIGWFLTGESRPYKRGSGTFDRVVPRASYGSEDGSGAWEVAVRYSSVDLTDGAIVGGEQDDVIVGLNWYLTPNLRICTDYVIGSVDLGAGLDDEDVNALMTRVQFDW